MATANFRLRLDEFKEGVEGVDKWKVGVVVGVGILGVAGFWLYRKRKRNNANSSNVRGFLDSNQNANVADDKPKTLHERAMDAKVRGNKHFKSNEFVQAITCYSEAMTLCPEDRKEDLATFYQNRAAAHEQLNNLTSVVEDCSEALELNKHYIKALFRRCKAYESLHCYESALEDITAVCILEGFANHSNLQVADRIIKEMSRIKSREMYSTRKANLPSKFFVRNYFAGFTNDPIVNLGNTGKVGSAANGVKDMASMKAEENSEDESQSTIVENGDVTEEEKLSPYEQAVLCLENNEFKEILDLCAAEIEKSDGPYAAKALLLRATFSILCGLGDQALVDLSNLLQMDGLDPKIVVNALIKQGTLNLQRSEDQAALDCFIKAETVDPDNADIYHHRGMQYLLQEKPDLAIADFDKSMAIRPDFPTTNIQKCYAVHRQAVIKENLSLLQSADEAFREVILRFPTCSDAYTLYGQSLADQGKFAEADEAYAKAVELEPDNPNTKVHRGLLQLQWKNSMEGCLMLVQEAIDLDPKCEYAYEILGTLNIQLGKMDEALVHLKHAMQLSKSEAEMCHLSSMVDAATVQIRVARRLGMTVPGQNNA